jgi:DNA helicase IV
MFTHYEKLALRMCKNKYETIYKRIKRRSKYHDETTNDNEINLAGSLEFKVNTYFVICDSLIE